MTVEAGGAKGALPSSLVEVTAVNGGQLRLVALQDSLLLRLAAGPLRAGRHEVRRGAAHGARTYRLQTPHASETTSSAPSSIEKAVHVCTACNHDTQYSKFTYLASQQGVAAKVLVTKVPASMLFKK